MPARRTALTSTLAALLLPVPAWAITLTGLTGHEGPAESTVDVSFGARPDGLLECDMVLGPDPGLSFRWDADRDGNWDVGWSDTATFSVPTAGVDGPRPIFVPVQAHCYAFDLFSLSFREELRSDVMLVNVNNVPPVLGSFGVLGVAPDALIEGTAYDFGAFATDVEPADVIDFTWVWSDGVVVTGNPATRAFDDGSYTATVRARDDDGSWAEGSYAVTVINVAPEILALSLPDALEGTPVTLSATVVDPYDTPTYTWRVDGQTLTGPSPSVVLPDDGVYAVELTVDDGDATDVASGSLLVRNVAPVPTITGDIDDSDGPTLGWTVHIVDPGADGHTVDWDFGDGTQLLGVGTSASHPYATNGVYTVTATVTDDDGAVGVGTLTVTISGFGPSITAVAAPSPVDEGAVASLSCTAVDVWSTGRLTYAWRFGDGTTAVGAATTHAWADDGSFDVRCTVTDGAGESTFATRTVVVTNVVPVISGAPPLRGVEGNRYRFAPLASDPGADVLTWSGTVPAGGTIAPATGAVDWTPARGDAGLHVLAVVVSDGDGGVARLQWTVDVAVRDLDGDGLSDFWEDDYGLDPTDPSDAADDGDGDGRTNLDEYAGGTDPTSDDRPPAPVLLSPSVAMGVPRTIADRPALRLEPVTSPAGDSLVYDVRVSTDEAVPVVVGSATSIPAPAPGVTAWTAWTVSPALTENAHYTWSARASDGYGDGPWAAPAAFQVNAVEEPPSAAILSWPPDGTTVATTSIQLRFFAATDPDDDVVFHTAIVRSLAGAELARASDLTGSGQLQAAVSLAADDQACWHVEVVDSSGRRGPSSPTWCFLVDPDNLPPTAPQFSFPVDGLVLDDATPELVVRSGVDPEGRASWHQFQLDTVPTFDSPDLREASVPTTPGTTSWSPGELVEDTWYHARALATDGGATSAWTSIAFFVNAFNAAPTVPRLVVPSDGADVAGRVAFEVADVVDPEGLGVTVDIVVRSALGDTNVASVQGLAVGADGRAVWVTDPLPTGEYRWTARSVDAQDDASAFAPIAAFWVVDPAELTNSRPLPDAQGPGETLLAGCGCAQGGAPGGVLALLVGLVALVVRRR